MRAIDADTLLKKVEKIRPWEPYPSRYAQGIRYCMELVGIHIKDAPTIEPEPHWIPCRERLPDEKINPNTQDYDWVLCSTTFGDVRAYHFGRGRFLHGCGDVTQYVTAWMPLPEPYKGDQE